MWCGLTYGEEDEEWEIIFIPGRGTAIRAKKVLPPLFRIIVEGYDRSLEASDHSGISKSRRRTIIPNHDCDANADMMPLAGKKLGVS
jgi:hypothetical protein